jgi:hypothetical protein
MVQRKSVGNLGNKIKSAGRSGLKGLMHLVANLLWAVLSIPTFRMKFLLACPVCATIRAYQPYGVKQVKVWE